MKIKILGCGYLGFNVNQVFKDKYDCEIWGLKNYYSDKAENFKEIDVFDINTLDRENLKDCIIFDCISLISNTETDDNKLTFIKGKYSLLFRSLKKKGIKRFIMLSSGGTIYGDSYEAISEYHQLNPQSVYAKSKFMLEEMLKESGLNYLILRPTNPYGGILEPDKQQGVISILIKKALKDESFNLWTDEGSIRDYIYISDFVNAVDELIKHNINNEVVNISSGYGASLKEVIDIVEKYTNKKVRINNCDIDVPIIKSIVLSNQKLKDLTDFVIKVNLREGISLEVNRIMEELK